VAQSSSKYPMQLAMLPPRHLLWIICCAWKAQLELIGVYSKNRSFLWLFKYG